jgi:hypothetical protein
LKADRHVHRDQNNGHRDNRAAQLACGDERRFQRRLALFHMPVDVLDHDNRVVDDQANRQHQREQREQVDRIASISMTKKVPTSDSGMAIKGITTARKLPRKRKITMDTMTSDWIRVFTTSSIELLMNFVPS